MLRCLTLVRMVSIFCLICFRKLSSSSRADSSTRKCCDIVSVISYVLAIFMVCKNKEIAVYGEASKIEQHSLAKLCKFLHVAMICDRVLVILDVLVNFMVCKKRK